MDQTHRKYALKGLRVGARILLVGVIGLIFFMVYKFDGQCGGWIPFLSGSHDCSLIEFLVTDGLVITLLAVVIHSPWILLFLLAATLTGYGFGRRKTKKDSIHREPSPETEHREGD